MPFWKELVCQIYKHKQDYWETPATSDLTILGGCAAAVSRIHMKPGASLEKDVQSVYNFLLNMKDEGVVVGNKVFMTGKSGVQHEIDVFYEFTRAGVRHRVAIECKDWSTPVCKGQIQEFESKLRDIGDITGVVVSRNGYQSGARDFAKFRGIPSLLFEELPSINYLLGERIKIIALPNKNCYGEPFWIIMELRDKKITGSHFTMIVPGIDRNVIPLTFSKLHAEQIFKEVNLNPERWAIRGLPRYALRAFLVTLELYEKRMDAMAMIFFSPPGALSNSPLAGIPASRDDLIRDYYCESIPSIESIK